MLFYKLYRMALCVSAILVCGQAKATELSEAQDLAFKEEFRTALEATIWPEKKFHQYDDKTTVGSMTIKLIDEYGGPKFYIWISQKCDRPFEMGRACRANWTARRVVTTIVKPGESHRYSGSRFLTFVAASHLEKPYKTMNELMQDMPLDWQIADLNTCPGIIEHLQLSTQDVPIFALEKNMDGYVQFSSYMALGSDKYEVLSRTIGHEFTMTTLIGSPYGQWVNELSDLLESCWRPNDEIPPWELIDDIPVPEID